MFLSILMCVNKDNPFFYDALMSVINQNYHSEDFEIVLVANNCDDAFFHKLEELANVHSLIKLHRTSIGQLAYNLNFGAEHCKSDYIVRMDADDISLPDRLNIVKNFIIDNNYPDVGVFSANLINDNNELIGIVNSPADIDQFRKKLCFGNPIVHPASCIRKKALLNNRGYIGGLNCEDFDLWLRMDRSNCNFSFSNQVVLNYRISEHQCAGSRIGYSDVTGFLLRESLYRRSFKFFIGFTYRFLVFIYLDIKKSMK